MKKQATTTGKHENEITLTLCKNVFLARKLSGLTQIKLGTLLGIDPDTVRSWEACRKRPSDDHVWALSAVMGMKGRGEWLWFWQDHPEIEKMLEEGGAHMAQFRAGLNIAKSVTPGYAAEGGNDALTNCERPTLSHPLTSRPNLSFSERARHLVSDNEQLNRAN